MKNIAIFASGSGTNAERIIEYFNLSNLATIKLILSNNNEAFVLERARKFKVPTFVFNKNEFYQSEIVLNTLKDNNIDFVVLAGFLWLIPTYLIKAYPNRIINIHPALLPKYGGKGMYGHHVHEAVIQNKENESGITIHYVNERYDDGNIIFQAPCKILPSDTPDSLAERIHTLEYEHFPVIIEKIIKDL